MTSLQADPSEDTWEDITDEHQQVRQDIEQKFDKIVGGPSESVAPSAIVGPYRSGKTQLLYHAFHYAWNNGVPALYTDALSIFRGFQEDDDAQDITDWIESKIESELENIKNGEESDWLPNWETTRKKQDWIDKTEEATFEPNDYTVLLIDEVEQAYTQIRRGFEDALPADLDTDDRNPLRIILDEVDNTHQVWTFGLISAYEFRGEADAGRFEEFRLPILRPHNVAEMLDRRDKNKALATGIWWLARGRIGWVRKLAGECPSSRSAVADWVAQVSDYRFSATSPIDKQVFEELDSNSASEWDDARETLLFLNGANSNSEWKVSSERSIPVTEASTICTDAILAQADDIDFAAKELVMNNCDRLFNALPPAESWTGPDADQMMLPYTLLFQSANADAVLDILRNFVISFEASNETRSEVINLLDDIEVSKFRDAWMEETVDHVIDTPSWTVKPEVLNIAYPSIAVNPSRLTDIASETIQEELDRPLLVESSINNRRTHVHVKPCFCPTEDIFQTAAQNALEPADLDTTFALFIPEGKRDEWDLTDSQQKAREHERISIEPHGGKVFWDFLLQLHKYLDTTDPIEPFSKRAIDQALKNEPDREMRNTVRTLFEQVRNVTNETVEIRSDKFTDRYSLPKSDVPIWGEDALNSDVPFWSYGGSANTPRTGLSYAMALSTHTPLDDDPVLSLRNTMIAAFDDSLLDKSEFKFKEFLDLSLRSDNYSAGTEKERSRLRGPEGNRLRSVEQTGRYLWQLASNEGFDHGQPVHELTTELTNLGRLADRKQEGHVTLIENSSFEFNQAPALVWGLLLDKAAQRKHLDPGERLERLTQELGSLQTEARQVINNIQNKNEHLSPPGEVGRSTEIRMGELEAFLRNLNTVHESTENLLESYRSTTHEETITVVIELIVSKYRVAMANELENELSELTDISLSPVERAKQNFEDLVEHLESSEAIAAKSESTPEELVQELRDYATDLFDYQAQAGSPRIGLQERKALLEVRKEARETSSELSRYLDEYFEIEDRWEKREQARRTTIETVEALLQDVEGWD